MSIRSMFSGAGGCSTVISGVYSVHNTWAVDDCTFTILAIMGTIYAIYNSSVPGGKDNKDGWDNSEQPQDNPENSPPAMMLMLPTEPVIDKSSAERKFDLAL